MAHRRCLDKDGKLMVHFALVGFTRALRAEELVGVVLMSRYEVKFALMRVVARTSLLCSAGAGALSQEMPWGKEEALGLCRGDAASWLARRHQPEESQPHRPAIRLSLCGAVSPILKAFMARPAQLVLGKERRTP